MNEKSKAMITGLCLTALCFGLCSCGADKAPADPNEGKDRAIDFTIENETDSQISAVSASWYINGEKQGETGLTASTDEEYLGESELTFFINQSDVNKEKDLETLTVVIGVTDSNGGTYDVDTLELPSEFGDKYYYELNYEDGHFSVLAGERDE